MGGRLKRPPFSAFKEAPIETTPPPGRKKDAQRNADSYFVTWERRTSLVKQQVAAESAANDAKTARLRAERLAKEEADKDAGTAADIAPKSAEKKRVRAAKG